MIRAPPVVATVNTTLPVLRQRALCNNGQVEDEIHFLLFCDKYNEIRRKLYGYVHDIENFQGLGNIDKLQLLLNDPMLVKQTAIFITEAYEYRSTII